jgi:flavin-dependent dehydrogenase
MDVPSQCDVAVIGGGPAGSMAASLLARQGYDVVLLERARHPRYNVGESLIPQFWRFCELTGADEPIAAEGFVEKAGGTVVWNGVVRQMRFRDFGYERPALHVERDRFDVILLEHARKLGARVYEEVAATAATLSAHDGSSVAYRRVGAKERGLVSCRYVLDASGQAAVVSRQLGLRVVDEGFRFISLWGYFADSRYVGADGRIHPFEQLLAMPPTTFVANLDGWSWLWHIPQRAETSVGLVVSRDELRGAGRSQQALEDYFLRRCLDVPYVDRLLEGARYVEGSFHAIRNYSYRPTEVAGPGFFLLGDAAAFIDPIFSIGVVFALYSGWLAAWAVDRSFRRPDRTTAYQAMFARQFTSRLEASRSLALPRYGAGGAEADAIRESFAFESSVERDLMLTASSLSTRSENFLEAAGAGGSSVPAGGRFRVLDDIVVAEAGGGA